ncbi:MAG: hypothetical protein HYR55_17925 [Acidobacteria bacterium]|nr:hypothetical protein [Acidobacteriota bacterium]MBI3655982.1 hypothetical protein [Acidobacteriota bacterium]
MTSKRWPLLVLAAILTLAAALYALALEPARFGFIHDDGVYVIMAKSLAEGHGYRILSLPGEPPQTKFPPLYPFLLSLVWRVFPNFPANLAPMMVLSAGLVWLTLPLVYFYLRYELQCGPRQSLLIVGLLTINWRLVLLSGSLYSEALYTLLSIAALWAGSRYASGSGKTWVGGLAGLLLGLTFLTRTSGLALIVATAMFFLHKRAIKKLVLILGLAAIVVLPWLLWRAHEGVPNENPIVASYTSYGTQFSDIIASPSAILRVIRNNFTYLLVLFVPLVTLSLEDSLVSSYFGLPVILVAFALIALGFLRALHSGIRLVELYIISYVGMLLLWPFACYDRFILPLVPFSWLFLTNQLKRFVDLSQPSIRAEAIRRRRFTLTLKVIGFVLLSGLVYRHIDGTINLITRGNPSFRPLHEKQSTVFRWLRENTSPDSVLVSYDLDPLYNLYSGRKAVLALCVSAVMQQVFDLNGQKLAVETELERIIEWSAADYLILRRSYGSEFDSITQMVRRTTNRFDLVYRSADEDIWVFQIQRKW